MRNRSKLPLATLALLAGLLMSTAGTLAQPALSVQGIVAATSGGFRFPDGTLQTTAVGPFAAAVPDTGQRECFDGSGDPVSCVGTGQDGETQAGVSPPTPRFTVNGDGTVTDNLTGLIWLREANCFGERSWEQALADAATLQAGFCGLLDGTQPGDWRLPNVLELFSLSDFGQVDPALPQGHPFEDVQSDLSAGSLYWTSTSQTSNPERAWAISAHRGGISFGSKSESLNVWPVREAPQGTNTSEERTVRAPAALSVDGAIASTAGGFQFPDGTVQTTAIGPLPALVPKTGQQQCFDVDGNEVACSGTGQDGETRSGVEPPSVRFEVNGDGTVTDNLSGLIWLRDADCFGQRTWEVALSDANTLEAGFCGLLDGSQAGDWRLPTVRELVSLIDFGHSAPALPQSHPFTDVQLDGEYWASTTGLREPQKASVLLVETGVLGLDDKEFEPTFLWPVRGGL